MFLLVISTLPRILIPEQAIEPNITIPAAPRTGLGIIDIKEANFGIRPIIDNIIPAIIITNLLATPVTFIRPVHWLKDVFAVELKNPARIDPRPSQSTPPESWLSETSISHASPIARVSPTVSTVVAR